MVRIRRGGYVFVTWKSDHTPPHVHVYQDGRLILKWNLLKDQPMAGTPTRKLRRLIAELKSEGFLE